MKKILLFVLVTALAWPVSLTASLAMAKETTTSGGKTSTETSYLYSFPSSKPDFVNHLYNSVLGRQPDSAGYNFWLGVYQRGANPTEMYRAFYNSSEFSTRQLSNSAYVTNLYNSVYFRDPDAGGLNFWVRQMDINRATKQQILQAFVSHGEYFDIISPQLLSLPNERPAVTELANIATSQNFIEHLFVQMTGRNGDPAGINYWNDEFNNSSRQDPVREMYLAFFASDESLARNATNAQFVQMMYRAVLFRQPDAAGQNFWLYRLNYSGMTRSQLLQAFLSTSEFNNNVYPKLNGLRRPTNTLPPVSQSPGTEDKAGSIEDNKTDQEFFGPPIEIKPADLNTRQTK